MIKSLDENTVYWLGGGSKYLSDEDATFEAVMIHLSNNPTGERDSAGRVKDNIKNEGWYLFRGKIGRMKPVKKLSDAEAIKLINKKMS